MLADALRSCMLMASHCQNKPQVLTVNAGASLL